VGFVLYSRFSLARAFIAFAFIYVRAFSLSVAVFPWLAMTLRISISAETGKYTGNSVSTCNPFLPMRSLSKAVPQFFSVLLCCRLCRRESLIVQDAVVLGFKRIGVKADGVISSSEIKAARPILRGLLQRR
jgi:hypothetical protein